MVPEGDHLLVLPRHLPLLPLGVLPYASLDVLNPGRYCSCLPSPHHDTAYALSAHFVPDDLQVDRDPNDPPPFRLLCRYVVTSSLLRRDGPDDEVDSLPGRRSPDGHVHAPIRIQARHPHRSRPLHFRSGQYLLSGAGKHQLTLLQVMFRPAAKFAYYRMFVAFTFVAASGESQDLSSPAAQLS